MPKGRKIFFSFRFLWGRKTNAESREPLRSENKTPKKTVRKSGLDERYIRLEGEQIAWITRAYRPIMPSNEVKQAVACPWNRKNARDTIRIQSSVHSSSIAPFFVGGRGTTPISFFPPLSVRLPETRIIARSCVLPDEFLIRSNQNKKERKKERKKGGLSKDGTWAAHAVKINLE